jgi:hypothetical protein
VRVGILVGKPARRVDPIENIVSYVERKVEPVRVVLDVTFQRKVRGVRGRGKLRDPASVGERGGVIPLAGRDYTVQLRGGPWIGAEFVRKLTGSEGQTAEQQG